MSSEPAYTVQELLVLVEEYFRSHPESDGRDHVESTSPAETYHEGAVDFLQWLVNNKQFLYEPETLEDIADEDVEWMQMIGAADALFITFDKEEKEGRTY